MSQNTLNEIAQKRFENLKAKMKLNFVSSIKEETKHISEEKINKMFDTTQALSKEEINVISETPGLADAINESGETEHILNFISSLKLPPQLSLAIGLIISGYKTNSDTDLNNASDAIQDYKRNISKT